MKRSTGDCFMYKNPRASHSGALVTVESLRRAGLNINQKPWPVAAPLMHGDDFWVVIQAHCLACGLVENKYVERWCVPGPGKLNEDGTFSFCETATSGMGWFSLLCSSHTKLDDPMLPYFIAHDAAKEVFQTLPQPIFEEVWNHVGWEPSPPSPPRWPTRAAESSPIGRPNTANVGKTCTSSRPRRPRSQRAKSKTHEP
jgi:hypothetical protein